MKVTPRPVLFPLAASPSKRTLESPGMLKWVPCSRTLPMICRISWLAVRQVIRDLRATLSGVPLPLAGSSWLGGCSKNRKDLSSASGFAGILGSSTRCWSRSSTCRQGQNSLIEWEQHSTMVGILASGPSYLRFDSFHSQNYFRGKNC